MLDVQAQTTIASAINVNPHANGYSYGPYHRDVSESKPIRLGKLSTQICGFCCESGTQCGGYVKQPGGFRRHVRSHFIQITGEDRRVADRVKGAELAADKLVLQLDRKNYTAADIDHFRLSCLKYVLDGHWHGAMFVVEPQHFVTALKDAMRLCMSLSATDVIFARAFGSPSTFFRGPESDLQAVLIDLGLNQVHDKALRSSQNERQAPAANDTLTNEDEIITAGSLHNRPGQASLHDGTQFTSDVVVHRSERQDAVEGEHDSPKFQTSRFVSPTSRRLRTTKRLQPTATTNQDTSEEDEADYFPWSRSLRRQYH